MYYLKLKVQLMVDGTSMEYEKYDRNIEARGND